MNKLNRMKKNCLTCLILCLAVNLSFADKDKTVSLGEYQISLTEHWHKANEKQVVAGYDAIWVDPKSKQPRAVLLAKSLIKTLSKEADQMAASPKKNPEFIKLLEDRKFKTKKGTAGRVVSLQILAGNEEMGIEAPMIFHSVYFPTKDGKSVTFKLQCAVKDFNTLKKAFEQMVISEIVEK